MGAIALLLAVFCTGAVAGVAGYRWVLEDAKRDEMPAPPEELRFRLRPLALSDAQETQVRSIFEKYRPELDSVLRETFPRVRAVQERIDADIAKVLTEEQRRKFLESATRRKRPHFRPPHERVGFPAPLQPPPFGVPPEPSVGPIDDWKGPGMPPPPAPGGS
jgi:Spy/CpxP family protein refolding chaperone